MTTKTFDNQYVCHCLPAKKSDSQERKHCSHLRFPNNRQQQAVPEVN